MKNHLLLLCLLLLSGFGAAQHQWVRAVGGEQITDAGNGTATDGAGNVYVTGAYNGQNIDFGNGVRVSSTLSTYSSEDLFLAKYNRNGVCLWVRSIPGAHTYGGVFGGMGITVDVFGNVFICGEYDGSPRSFGNGVTVPRNSGGFVARFDSAGNTMWVSTMYDSARNGSPNSVQPAAITHDAAGNVYITGGYKGPVIIGGKLVPGDWNNANVFVAKYTFNGFCEWVRTNTVARRGIIFGAIGRHISWSPDNQVYVTGIYGGLQLDFTGGYTAPYDSLNIHLFTARFDTRGSINLITYTSGFGLFYTGSTAAAVLDPLDNCYYVAGYTTMGTNATINFGNGFTVQTDPQYNGIYAFLVKKSYYGTTLWVRTMKTSYATYLANVLTDAQNNAYICGLFSGAMPVDFGGTPYTPQGADLVVAKFNPQGAGTIVQAGTGSIFLQPKSFALTDSAKPVITGIFRGEQVFPPLPPINRPSMDMFLVKGTSYIPPLPRDTARLWVASRDVAGNDTANIAFYLRPGEAGAVTALEIHLTYDTNKLTVIGIDSTTLPGGAAGSWGRSINIVRDTIKIAVYGASAVWSVSQLFKLQVYIRSTAVGTTPLTFKRALVNTGTVPVRSTDGLLTIRTTDTEEKQPIHLSAPLQVFPNPFRESADIHYRTKVSGNTVFTLYDVAGRQVHTFSAGEQEAGNYSVRLTPGPIPGGVYLLAMYCKGAITTTKVIILK